MYATYVQHVGCQQRRKGKLILPQHYAGPLPHVLLLFDFEEFAGRNTFDFLTSSSAHHCYASVFVREKDCVFVCKESHAFDLLAFLFLLDILLFDRAEFCRKGLDHLHKHREVYPQTAWALL